MTKIMKASEFKAKCLAVMDEVASTREAVVVTKNGVPLVELVVLAVVGAVESVVALAANKQSKMYGINGQ